jgi:hypothetical protein
MFEHNIYPNRHFLATPLATMVGSNGVMYAHTITNNPS